uniref:sphingomyelin phosphodiesterase n=1 Tax=Phallusia mammillata TaxID=59560 RepID=A0A6F9DU53_9ASCI|nr:sphingomyelin phosphodiesterase 3 [Phallusia mammillata]
MAQRRKNPETPGTPSGPQSSLNFEGAMNHATTPVFSLEEEESIVPGGPYVSSNLVIRFSYELSKIFFIPLEFSVDSLLSMFIHTTSKEVQNKSIVWFLIKALLFLILLFVSIPLALFAFIIWCPLQLIRPRAFTYVCATSKPKSDTNYKRISSQEFHATSINPPLATFATQNPNTYSLVTANICLMPEFVAHINNLCNSKQRGRKIADYFCGRQVQTATNTKHKSNQRGGDRFTETDCLFTPWSSENLNLGNGLNSCDSSITETGSITSTLWSISSKEQCVSDVFPGPSDFLCLQEVFDGQATNCLIEGLQTKYPHIIYDVSWPIHDRRLSILGSGLCVASRHPFIDAKFRAFPDGHRDDKLACKGLLMTKIFLGSTDTGEDLVGFVANTHLQAWSHSSASSVRCKQLNCISLWMEEFQTESKMRAKTSKEVTVFNIITGDFNFDRVSHYDSREQHCHFLNNFVDPCIDSSSGNQHSWVVGTELNQKMIHTDPVCTPQGLQRMLVSELERHQYVASTMAHKSTLTRNGDGKRRIDYILYKPCQDVQLGVKDFKFFTGLATMSDHIPVGMMFSCERVSS